jgi:predicted protein tyrosine phosphatase
MGPALKGELGSDFAAGALIFHLNKMGGSWSPPERATGHERGVDFTSSSSAGALAIQVTRVPQNPARWQRVHHGGHVSGAVNISLAAEDLIEAILQKGGKSHPKGNADVTLVLDGSSDLAYMLENTLRSAGTEEGARIRVTAGHLGWADVVFVMENRHVTRLQEKFRAELAGKRVVRLHIPDEFEYMDEDLIDRLRGGVAPHVDCGEAAGSRPLELPSDVWWRRLRRRIYNVRSELNFRR